MKSVYLGRQPIVDKNEVIHAYQILYRDKTMQGEVTNDRSATASVINSVLNTFGTKELLGNYKAFIKIDQKFLMHDIIFTIPSEFFIFSLLETVEINERTKERLEQLHNKGYELCIEHITEQNFEYYAPVLKLVDYVKISFEAEGLEHKNDLIGQLKSYKIKVIGVKVETHQIFQTALSAGCDLFEGYFFAAPKIMSKSEYEPSQMRILKLYNLLLQDVNIDEITKEFELNHELTVRLLQFINSGYFSFKNRISTIHHILVLVGRVPISQWLMLMIYSKSISKEGDQKSPLMLMVKNRTELMQGILKIVRPNSGNVALGEAYFTGVLSLMSTVFNVELEKIVSDLNVSDDVKNAILYEEGILGEIFAVVKGIESFDTEAIADFEYKYNIPSEALKNIILQSIKEVNNFEHPRKPA